MSFQIIDSVDISRIDELMELYQNEWWTRTRERKDVIELLQTTTFTFGVIAIQSNKMVAFTRVLSDRIYKGVIFDVIVHPDYRGMKLGRLLIEYILDHPNIKPLESLELYCLDLHKHFYEKLGFESINDKYFFMRLKKGTT